MAGVLKTACGRTSLAHSIHWCPRYYFFCLTIVSILWRVCVYIHISDCVQTIYELPFLPNNTAVKHFYMNWEQCKVFTRNLSLGCLPSGNWVNTWHWTKRFTIPVIHRWPKCPNESQMSAPLPIQWQLYWFCNGNLTALDFLLIFCLHFVHVNTQYVLTNTCRRQ